MAQPSHPQEKRALIQRFLFSDPRKSFNLSVDLFSNLVKQELMDQILSVNKLLPV